MLAHHDEDDMRSLKSRHYCTDIPCCLLFVATLIAFSILYGYGLAHGNIGKLYHGVDWRGQICGIDVPDKPYLYWCTNSAVMGTGLSLNLMNPVCVSSCPGTPSAFGVQFPVQMECAQVSGTQGLSTYKTMVMFNRYCIPDSNLFSQASQQVYSGVNASFSERLLLKLSSVPSAWPILLGSFFVAIILGYLFLVLLRHCARPLIWISIIVVISAFIALGIYCWVNAGFLSAKLPADVQPPPGYGSREKQYTQIFAGIMWILAAICICIACCMGGNISAAAACIEVACDAMFEMPSLLLAPIVKAVLKGNALFILSYGFFACLSTVEIQTSQPAGGSIAGGVMDSTVQGVYRHFHLTTENKIALLFYVFVAYWIEYFLSALYEFVVGYAAAEYYYAPIDHDGDKDVGCCALWDAFHVGIVFHAGSLAFGSFLVAVFGVIKLILDLLEYQNQAQGGNRVISCIIACISSFVQCFKWIVEFINRNAYVDIAITSSSYCTAARESVAMIAEMGGAMAILNGATWVFATFGSLLVAAGCFAFSLMVTSSSTFANEDSPFVVASPALVAGFSGLIGLSVAACFMIVFDMTSDALLFCYGLDMRDHRPSPHAPQALKELYHEHSGGGGYR